MKVATYNILKAGNFSELTRCASNGAEVICIQEVKDFQTLLYQNYGDVENGHGLVKGGRKLDHSNDPWHGIGWPNDLTQNKRMGVAIMWKWSKFGDVEVGFSQPPVHTVSKKSGVHSASELRALPWIIAKEPGFAPVQIYSYHSSSAGDKQPHVKDVYPFVKALVNAGLRAAVFGDFNIEAGIMKDAAQNGAKLDRELGNETPAIAPPDNYTRPASQRKIDYCVHDPGLDISVGRVLAQQGSDHCPVLYEISSPPIRAQKRART